MNSIREEWRPLARYTGYEVNNMGEVRKVGDRVPLPTYFDQLGYVRLSAVIDGHQQQAKVHTLIAETFCGPRPSPRHGVNHIDGVKENNWALNLEWATPQQQADHAMKLGLWDGARVRGERNGIAKLTEDDVRMIRRLNAEGCIYRNLAERFGVSRSAIGLIIRGKHWAHVK